MDNQLDPTVVNLAKAIRQTETGGDYSAKGKSGESGGYQFTDPTWNAEAPKYGINVPLSQATPEQQNAVAYNKINDWKKQGFDVTQIASMWNAGQGEPNAYTGKFSDGSPSSGVNKENVNFNVPKYVSSVASAYNTLKQGGQVEVDPNNPSSTTGQQYAPPQDNNYGALNPASESDSPLQAGLKAVENTPSSFLNLAKGISGAILHPIQTVEGLGNAAIGGVEEGVNRLKGNPEPQNNQTGTFDSLAQAFKDRYGSLENLQKTATNDPAGFGADVLTLLEGGAGALDAVTGGSRAAETARIASQLTEGGVFGEDAARTAQAAPDIGNKGYFRNALDKGLSVASSPITKPLQMATDSITGGTAGLLGQTTGAGGDAIRGAYQAGQQGGEVYKTFIDALKGNSNPEDISNLARGALDQIESDRNSAYSDSLDKIKGIDSSLDISPITKEWDNQLKKFNINKLPDGELDFSRSSLANVPEAQTRLNKIAQQLSDYGLREGDRTPKQVDILKRSFSSLYTPSSDARSIVEGMRSTTRDVLSNVDGYDEMSKAYEESSNLINELKQTLSLGDNTRTETTINKLMSALSGKNPLRQKMLQELDEITGGKLKAAATGMKLSPKFSSGLLAKVGEGGAFYHLLATGPSGILPLLGIAVGTSPRLAGVILSQLGIRGAQASRILEMLSPALKAGAVSGVINQRINRQKS